MSSQNHKSFEVEQKFFCESARFLPRLPKDHPCGHLHGHSFEVRVIVAGPKDPVMEWVIDYQEIQDAFLPLKKTLDHRVLNDVPGLENPTTENVVQYIYEFLKPRLPLLSRIEVSETSTTRTSYPALTAR